MKGAVSGSRYSTVFDEWYILTFVQFTSSYALLYSNEIFSSPMEAVDHVRPQISTCFNFGLAIIPSQTRVAYLRLMPGIRDVGEGWLAERMRNLRNQTQIGPES